MSGLPDLGEMTVADLAAELAVRRATAEVTAIALREFAIAADDLISSATHLIEADPDPDRRASLQAILMPFLAMIDNAAASILTAAGEQPIASPSMMN